MDFEEFIELWNAKEWIGEIEDRTSRSTRSNESCGDEIQVDVKIVNGTIVNCKFIGVGCCLCKASAAYLCERSLGQKVEDALQFDIAINPPPTPIRQKCVVLAIDTFREALNGSTKNQGK